MLRNLFATARRFASSDSPRKVVVCSNGTIAAWHPPQEFPYEHTKPIDLSSKTDQTQRRAQRDLLHQQARVVLENPRRASPQRRRPATSPEIMHFSNRFLNRSTVKVVDLELVKANKSETQSLNFILALEHQPVYTVGIRSKGYTKEEEERLKALGAEFYRTSRGGLITFHGPGQLVLYPICDVRRVSTKQLGVRSFVDKLEQTIIDSATDGFGIHNVGRTENTGVWVNGERKLAAIGIAVSGGVSYHGIAINCNTDLTWFDNIVGCGIEGVSTTSLSLETRRNISVSEARPILLNSFANNFECLLS
ncbi:hypothetical protein L3Y34_003474 [Caenorhabditis briggsae]|uniref:lipoyl(octanoyl) transferase n=1 Tax=Caenorhabditis briggsae TaxID=6238 RepID=A0AAE9ADD1_CAEBR|nr:hypothetical protein L3Y34_003474 [Caenorhabditis briggsae]